MNLQPGTAVTLIWTREGSPFELQGKVLETSEKSMRLSTDASALPSPDQRCVILLETLDREKLTARVSAVEDQEVSLDLGHMLSSRRYYPRVDTQAPFVFRALDLGPTEEKLSKRQTKIMKSWSRPHRHELNLSIDGVAFASPLAIPLGSRVKVKFRLPTSRTKDFSVVGEVVRTMLEEPADQEEYHLIALHLPNLAPETHQDLLEFTLYWQEQAMENLEQKEQPPRA